MIKIFRRIRQSFLFEGKSDRSGSQAARYLKYAIGEILLVVIGILIALQINNWNNQKQLEIIERKYLSEFRKNLEFDIKDIQFNIDFNQSKLQSNKVILQYLNKEISFNDSLFYHFGNLLGTTRTLPNTSTFENLKSRGLEIISNDSLRQQLSTLYSFLYHNSIDFEKQDDHRFQYETLVPEVLNAIELVKIWEFGRPFAENEILDNRQLKNAIVYNILLRETMLMLYDESMANVHKCIKHINAELEN